MEEISSALPAEPSASSLGSGFLPGLLEHGPSVVLAISAAFGAWAAWRGMNTWRAQLQGALAHRLLTAIYLLQDSLKDARSLFKSANHSGFDIHTPEGEDKLSRNQKVYTGISEDVRKCAVDLRVLALEAKATWDSEELEKSLEAIQFSVSKLRINIRNELHRMADGEPTTPEITGVLWSQSVDTGDDPFDKELGAAVKSAEDFLKPHSLGAGSNPISGT